MSAGRKPRVFVSNVRFHRNGSGLYSGYHCVRFRWKDGKAMENLIATLDMDDDGTVAHITIINVEDPFSRYDPDWFIKALVDAIHAAGDEAHASNQESLDAMRAKARATKRTERRAILGDAP